MRQRDDGILYSMVFYRPYILRNKLTPMTSDYKLAIANKIWLCIADQAVVVSYRIISFAPFVVISNCSISLQLHQKIEFDELNEMTYLTD